MNLNTMSEMYQTRTGTALGFLIKSRATGRLWTATHKTGLGQFVIADINRQKEALVSGSQDRYEFADHTNDSTGMTARRSELTERLAELTNKEGQLEADLETTRDSLTRIQDDISAIENELETIID